jgi:uncharacterized Zn finger protein
MPRPTRKPCRACGDTEVIKWTCFSFEPGKESVVTECRSCGTRRSTWTRNVKPTDTNA